MQIRTNSQTNNNLRIQAFKLILFLSCEIQRQWIYLFHWEIGNFNLAWKLKMQQLHNFTHLYFFMTLSVFFMWHLIFFLSSFFFHYFFLLLITANTIRSNSFYSMFYEGAWIRINLSHHSNFLHYMYINDSMLTRHLSKNNNIDIKRLLVIVEDINLILLVVE